MKSHQPWRGIDRASWANQIEHMRLAGRTRGAFDDRPGDFPFASPSFFCRPAQQPVAFAGSPVDGNVQGRRLPDNRSDLGAHAGVARRTSMRDPGWRRCCGVHCEQLRTSIRPGARDIQRALKHGSMRRIK